MDGHYDVVVVGGGAAGTYAAWRLLTGEVTPASPLPQNASQRRVALCELSDRIGGRLESLLPPGMENLRAEFGGMGFTDQDALVNALVKLFDLSGGPFPLGDSNNLYYLRGVCTSPSDSRGTLRSFPTGSPRMSRGSTPARSYPRRSRRSSPVRPPGRSSSGTLRRRSRTTAAT